jgi:hypothetical protein
MPKVQSSWFDRIAGTMKAVLARITPARRAASQPATIGIPIAAAAPRVPMPTNLAALLRSGSVYNVPRLVAQIQQTLASGDEVVDWPAIALTAHRDGRIRECAIKSLAAQFENGAPPAGFGPVELGLLLLRLNDWVPQVQRAAEELLTAWRPALPVRDLAKALPVLLNPDLWYRPSKLGRALIDGIVADPAVTAAAIDDLRDDDSNNAARLIRVTVMHVRYDEGLEELALHARHPGVRDIAFRALIGIANGVMTFDIGHRRVQRPTPLKPDRARLFERGVASRSAAVRYQAVQALGETLAPGIAARHFQHHLLDPAQQVAEVAAFWIANDKGDVRTPLRAHVHSGNNVKPHHCALLAKYGVVADHEDLVTLAVTSRGKLKIAALEAAMKLRSDKQSELEAIAFTGPLPEAAIAARRLISAGHLIAADQLIAAAKANPRDFMARKLWRMLAAHTPMVRLTVCVTLAAVLSEADLAAVAEPLPQQLPYPPADTATTRQIKADAQRISWLWRRIDAWWR